MGDQSKSLFERPLLAKLGIFQDANDQAQDALRAEKVAAEKQAILAEAYRQMPADLRQRAAEWGVSALMETIWLNGWDCGYRQSMRDRDAISATDAGAGPTNHADKERYDGIN